jgi:divalent metal cation (Fe/Co/Zn/Cd) transporter
MSRLSAGHHHSSAHYGNKDAVRAVIVSAVALGLASLLSGSASVLADGLHNSGDVLTSFILLFTFALVNRGCATREGDRP